MAATLARLKKLQEKIGESAGVEKLLRAARKEGLPVTREIVKDYLSEDAPKQVFRPPPESAGKTMAEAQGWRLQADMVDMKTKKTKWNGVEYSAILVVVDVASRRAWAHPCKTKAPQHVGPLLYRMLRTMQNSPGVENSGFISTDRGNEFTGPAANVMENLGFTHRTKDPQDLNALSLVDRVIQTLKRRLAQSLAAKGKSAPWPSRVAQVVAQYNATYHPAIRDEPEDFNKATHGVKRFLALQDNAEKGVHNQKLLEKRVAKLETEGAYRTPVAAPKAFRRGFYATYSNDVKEVQRIRGSQVTDTQGQTTDVKRILTVPVFSGTAADSLRPNNPRVSRQKDILVTPMMSTLYAFLSPGERISVASAASYLKEELGREEYRSTLRRAGITHLVRALALFDEEFEVEEGGYYVKRRG